MSYLLAMLLNIVYKYPKDMVVVTGRRSLRLANFEPIATRFTIGAYLTKEGFYDYNKAIVDDIVNAGRSGKYDIVFECVGDPAVEQNIELAMKVLNEGGVIAMEGLTEQEIEIDFKAVLEKNIFIKGFYRGSINSYQKSLRFIEEYKDIRENLERLINKDSDNKTINGFHKVSSTLELESVFHKAENKDSFGRIVINDIDLPSEYY